MDFEDTCKSHCSVIFVISPVTFSTAVYILEYYLKYLAINNVIHSAYSPWSFAHIFLLSSVTYSTWIANPFSVWKTVSLKGELVIFLETYFEHKFANDLFVEIE